MALTARSEFASEVMAKLVEVAEVVVEFAAMTFAKYEVEDAWSPAVKRMGVPVAFTVTP